MDNIFDGILGRQNPGLFSSSKSLTGIKQYDIEGCILNELEVPKIGDIIWYKPLFITTIEPEYGFVESIQRKTPIYTNHYSIVLFSGIKYILDYKYIGVLWGKSDQSFITYKNGTTK